MKNTILIINYNHSIDCINKSFLDEIYSPYFKKVIHYSDNPETHDGDINFMHTHQGWFSYGIFPHFYEKYSELLEDSDGVLYTHDDCIININILDQIDISKTMYDQAARKVIVGEFVTTGEFASQAFGAALGEEWVWWKSQVGEANLMKFWRSEKWSKYTPHGFVGYSDFLYLPKTLFNKKFVTILSDLHKHEVFLEIALPIAVNYINNDISMMDSHKYNTINSKILWGDRSIVHQNLFKWLTEDNITVVHPVKLRSEPALKQILRDAFNI